MAELPTDSLRPHQVGRLLTPLLAALHSPLAMVFGERHAVLIHNPAWHRLAQGRDGAGLVGRPIASVFPGFARLAGGLVPGAGARIARSVAAAPTPDGTATWWDLEVLAHPDDGRVTVVIAREATDGVLARRDAEHAEASLRSAGTRLQLIQEATGVGTWEWSRRTGGQSWSPAQFRLHGMDPARDSPPAFSEWLGMVHPEDRPALMAAGDHGFQAGHAAHHYEFRLRRADTGEERWLLALGRAVEVAADGRPQRIVGVNIDVTARRREIEALRASEARLRLAFDAAQIFAWSWDVESGAVTWDAGLEAAHGLEPGGFGGTIEAFNALVHPDDQAGIQEALRQALLGEQEHYEAEFRMRRVDGSWRWTITRGVVLRDSTGRPSRVVGVDYDITGRRLAESRLRESEARLRLAMMAAQLGTWERDLGTGVTVLDGTLAALLGVPAGQAGETTAHRWLDFVVPEDRPRVEAAYAAAMAERRGFEIEFRIRRADGAIRVVVGRGQPTASDRIVGVVQDVTEAKRAEGLLLESRSRFRGLFDSLEQFVALMAPDGELLKINRWALDFLGLPAADALGRRLWEPGWWDGAAGTLEACVAQARAGTFVRRQLRFGGKTRSVLLDVTLRPVRDDQGVVTLIAVEGREVAAKAASRDAALPGVDVVRLVQSVPLAVFAADAQGGSVFVSRFWTGYSGQDAAAALGLGWMDRIHPQDRARTLAMWTAALASGDDYEIEHRVLGADQAYRWFLTRAAASADPAASGRLWYGGSTDIDALVHARDAVSREVQRLEALNAGYAQTLRSAVERLDAESRLRTDAESALVQAMKLEALGQLTATVIHDFNNVLSVLTSCIALIRRRTDVPAVLELVALGEAAAVKAKGLVQQLLTFMQRRSRLPGVLDIGELVTQLSPLLRQALHAGITLEAEIADELPQVVGDPEQLELALLNLVVNARDAMPDGGCITLVAVRRDAAPDASPDASRGAPPDDEAGWLALSVRDDGAGMPEDVLLRATQPFFTTKADGKGTGLGLPSVRELVMQMGGRLSIESRVGAGTTVSMLIPPATFLPGTAPQDGDGAVAAGREEGTILLVDDNRYERAMIAMFLRRLGYTVAEADMDGAEAAAPDAFDLLIVSRPRTVAGRDRKGPDLAASRPGLPVIVLAHGDHAGGPGQTVLRKPLTGGALHQAVLVALGRLSRPGATGTQRVLDRIRDPRLRAYHVAWTQAAGGDLFPQPAALPPDLFGLDDVSFTVAIEAAATRLFHYVRIGRALMAQLDRDGNAELVSREAAGDELLGTLDGAYRRAERSRAPVYQSARFDFGDGAPVRFDRLLLPFSATGAAITHLIGVVIIDNGPGGGPTPTRPPAG